jgi:hypothetical protein
MFRLIACLSLLLVFYLPAASQVPTQDTYLKLSDVYPNARIFPVPLRPCASPDQQLTVDPGGLSYSFNINAEGGLILNLYSGYPSFTGGNSTTFSLFEWCGGEKIFLYRIHVCDGVCPRPKFNIKGQHDIITSGVRG